MSNWEISSSDLNYNDEDNETFLIRKKVYKNTSHDKRISQITLLSLKDNRLKIIVQFNFSHAPAFKKISDYLCEKYHQKSDDLNLTLRQFSLNVMEDQLETIKDFIDLINTIEMIHPIFVTQDIKQFLNLGSFSENDIYKNITDLVQKHEIDKAFEIADWAFQKKHSRIYYIFGRILYENNFFDKAYEAFEKVNKSNLADYYNANELNAKIISLNNDIDDNPTKSALIFEFLVKAGDSKKIEIFKKHYLDESCGINFFSKESIDLNVNSKTIFWLAKQLASTQNELEETEKFYTNLYKNNLLKS